MENYINSLFSINHALQNGFKSILDKYKVSNSRLRNEVKQWKPQWGFQATERSCVSKMEEFHSDKFAFVEWSSTIHTPVGCASDRTVLRTAQDDGVSLRQVRVCASNKHPCGVFERQNGLAIARWRGRAPTNSRLSDQQGFSAAGWGHSALQIICMFASQYKISCRERSWPFRGLAVYAIMRYTARFT